MDFRAGIRQTERPNWFDCVFIPFF
jgi:hypothetical protein